MQNEHRPDDLVLTRFWLIRALGFIYFVAFLSLYHQVLPLFGKDGLLPASLYLKRTAAAGGLWASFQDTPTVFWFGSSDALLSGLSLAGVGISLAVVLGVTNAVVMAVLWALYMSFVHVGQIFYGFGWEILLLEAGFLAIFACPATSVRPFAGPNPPRAVFWLFRWLLFRVMFGAGLIKLRGDACWRDLTCLVYHYETQPIPNPASWYLFQLPAWFHAGGVVINHLVELVFPFLLFGPGTARRVAAAVQIFFQLTLIVSGNLSFLNWLTIAVAIGCCDDAVFRRFWPAKWAAPSPPSRAAAVCGWLLVATVVVLSAGPVMNLVSPRQVMNTSFDRLHLVNTYGAFGTVGRTRPEVVLSGTTDESVTPSTTWKEYEFKAKPGDVRRRPPVLAPYHLRIDWLIWFAAMSDAGDHPWLLHLIWKLLHAHAPARSLLANDPFPERAPRWIKADLYEYRFTRWGDSPAWWTRRFLRPYLPPVSADDAGVLQYLIQNGVEEP